MASVFRGLDGSLVGDGETRNSSLLLCPSHYLPLSLQDNQLFMIIMQILSSSWAS